MAGRSEQIKNQKPPSTFIEQLTEMKSKTISDKSLRIRANRNRGFTLIEVLVSVTIVGLITSIAVPNYISQLCKTEAMEAKSTIASLQAIISAYIDETGVFPTSWDDLASISAIMTKYGIASGALTVPIELPSGFYKVSVNGPTNTTYGITARRIEGCAFRDINACLNPSNGASDMDIGDGSTGAKTVNCS